MGQLASDDFTRADSTGLGANWASAPAAEQWDVSSNQARNTHTNGPFYGRYVGVSAPADQYAKLRMKAFTADFGTGPAVRMASSQQTCYYVRCNTANSGLYKLINSVETQIGSNFAAVAVNDIVELWAQGTTLTVLVNGASVLTQTDSAISSGDFGAYGMTYVASTIAWDDWYGGDFTTPSPPSDSLNVVIGEAQIGGRIF